MSGQSLENQDRSAVRKKNMILLRKMRAKPQMENHKSAEASQLPDA